MTSEVGLWSSSSSSWWPSNIIWIICNKCFCKVFYIWTDAYISLFWSVSTDFELLSLFGNASVTDKHLLKTGYRCTNLRLALLVPLHKFYINVGRHHRWAGYPFMLTFAVLYVPLCTKLDYHQINETLVSQAIADELFCILLPIFCEKLKFTKVKKSYNVIFMIPSRINESSNPGV